MHRRFVSTCAAAALLLAACGGDDDQALQERIEQLEEQLTGADDADGDDADGDAAQGGETDDAEEFDGIGDPAEPRTIAIGETRELDGLELTVERLVAHEFHTEIEIVAINRTGETTIAIVNDNNRDRPSLFDERDRRFDYQHAAGGDSRIDLAPGERLDGTLTFTGAVQRDAELLTLQMTTTVGRSQSIRDSVEVQIPVAGS